MIINLPPLSAGNNTSKPTAASHSALETGLMFSIKNVSSLKKFQRYKIIFVVIFVG